jgi:hypothetical protein
VPAAAVHVIVERLLPCHRAAASIRAQNQSISSSRASEPISLRSIVAKHALTLHSLRRHLAYTPAAAIREFASSVAS